MTCEWHSNPIINILSIYLCFVSLVNLNLNFCIRCNLKKIPRVQYFKRMTEQTCQQIENSGSKKKKPG